MNAVFWMVFSLAMPVTVVRDVAETGDRPGWKLITRLASSREGGLRVYWVGLRNEDTRQHAVCGLGLLYKIDLTNGETVMRSSEQYPFGTASHSCGPDAGNLVLPGETYFVRTQVVIPKDAVRPCRLRFSLAAEEICPYEELCEQRQIEASGEVSCDPLK